jgi:adenylate cyclase
VSATAVDSTGRGSKGPFARRLAAIAFTDIVGYSALMSRDEDLTHGRWRAIRTDIIEPRLQVHRGKLVKSTGDGVLVEFSNVLDAVSWSRDVQDSIREANATSEVGGPRLELRIAVHLCDVIEEAEDIYGDGVNIAARLQAYAPPGGIVVSETVYDIVRISIELEAQSLGYLTLKNISTPVRAYVIGANGAEPADAVPSPEQSLPSIAVLPLQDLSADPGNSYFGDGIIEDIVVSLAGLRELLVISRASTLIYGAVQPDPRDVGRTLGVRYVLMGTVRRSEQRVRVSIQLCDTLSAASLWVDSFHFVPGELFDVQDRIVTRVVAGIAPHVRAVELRRTMRKRPENFTAYEHTLRALDCIHRLSKQDFLSARGFLKQAMALDPEFAMPVAWTARWYSLLIGQGWSEDKDRDANEGAGFASKAIDLDPENALALATFGHMKSFLFHEYDTALVLLERARSVCPSSALSWSLSSATMSYLGRCEEAIQFAERGLRLSPYDRSLFYSYMFLGLAHYVAGAYEEAVKWCRMSYSENRLYTANLRPLAAALAALGRVDHARQVVRDLLELEPSFSLRNYMEARQPFHDEKIREHFLSHLQLAGFPD